MKQVKLQSLFDNYLENKCSAEELLLMIELLQEAEAEDILSPQMETVWQHLKNDNTVNMVDWERMKNNVLASDSNEFKRRHKNRFLWLKIAAAATLLILSATVWYQLKFAQRSTTISYSVIHVPFKKVSVITLTDGSKIVLNSGSTFRYPNNFANDKREVYLNGEAYFQVTHENKRPFIIHSGKLNTQVLGTSFNVTAYPHDSKMMVTVLTGKVSVEEAVSHQRIFINPNERLTFDTHTGLLDKSVMPHAEDALAWQQGKLIFEDASLADVCQRLTLKFGTNIRLKNAALKDCRINATFDRQTLPQILHIIKRLTGITYQQFGNEMQISGEGCH